MMKRGFLLLFLLLLTGCGIQQVVVPPGAGTPTIEVIDSSGQTWIVCREPASTLPLFDPTLPVQQAVNRFVEDGAGALALEAALQTNGLLDLPGVLPIFDAQGSVREADLNGDRVLDLVVSVGGPLDADGRQPTTLLVYTCANSTYTLSVAEELKDVPPAARWVTAVTDLTADGAAEIVTLTSQCGASTCLYTLDVLALEGNTLVSQLADGPITFPLGEVNIANGALEITSGVIGSAGAGPQRERVWLYSWDGAALVRASDQPLTPPTYRFEAVLDGFATLPADAEGAYRFFGQALEDAALLDYTAIDPDDPRPPRLTNSMALYGRLVSSAAAFGFADPRTQEAFTALDSAQPIPAYNGDAAFASPWVAMGQAFFAAGDLAAGCAAARILAAEAIPAEGWNTRFFPDVGYANPTPSAQTLCPF